MSVVASYEVRLSLLDGLQAPPTWKRQGKGPKFDVDAQDSQVELRGDGWLRRDGVQDNVHLADVERVVERRCNPVTQHLCSPVVADDCLDAVFNGIAQRRRNIRLQQAFEPETFVRDQARVKERSKEAHILEQIDSE